VMNLLLNAGEAIGNRPGSIGVSIGAESLEAGNPVELAPGEYVYLEVRDTGSGMDEATKAKIFDPFFTTKFTGRGLGLAAVAGIVRAHRGAIQVTSELGNGSSFKVYFPLRCWWWTTRRA
jgi:two-component system cell cycle sensor histidine kinase/response regulator CckA